MWPAPPCRAAGCHGGSPPSHPHSLGVSEHPRGTRGAQPGMGAVTQLLGWVASRHCSAEITTTTTPHPPFIPSFLFVCVLTRNKSSSGDSCSGGQCARRAVMTEKERCPKVSERGGPQRLLNGKYGKGAMSPCTRWGSPTQPMRCRRSL